MQSEAMQSEATQTLSLDEAAIIVEHMLHDGEITIERYGELAFYLRTLGTGARVPANRIYFS